MAGPGSDTDISISFELFPPRTQEGLRKLERSVDLLSHAAPEYFSVTYGAGGTTREGTPNVVDMVMARTRLPVAHHLTCVGASRAEVDAQARRIRDRGINRIVALRGDIPGGEALAEDGYNNAAELVEGLMKVADFDISVAAYPEMHPEAASPRADLDHLKRKIDAGARRAITQYVFDTDTVLRFIDRARAAGIDAPIVPGIMPVTNFAGLKRFSEKCGASIPAWLAGMFDGLDEDPRMRDMVATSVAVEQCRRLAEEGLTDFHVYTLNRAEVSLAICRALGLPIQTGKKDAA